MSITRKTWAIVAGLVVLVLIACGVFFGVQRATHRTITAYFKTVASLYEGDSVRVIGVPIGTITSIEPREGDVKVVMRIDKDTPIPADVRAVIVAQSLVSGRFIQLTPGYSSGPELSDDADIPMERTAVPMEWDDVKKELSKLTEAIGPDGPDKGVAARAVDVFDENLDGNGAAIAESIRQMSTVMGTLADNRDDVFATVKSLQKLTDELSTSHEQLVQFNGRMASVSSVIADSSQQLGDAMTNLNEAIGELDGFLGENSSTVTSTVDKLAQLTGTLRKKDEQLRGLLHSAPTQLANFFNIYNPLTGSLDGVFGLGMGNNLITMLCGSMASTKRPGDTDADIEQCVDLIAPIMKDIVVNYPPFMANPVIGRTAMPDQITYQDASVRARARRGVIERDQVSRDAAPDPLAKLLVPFGGDR
ncbi:MCE family protein [Gordonia humi]|uniref:Phospholipid/cholesterol/gamma-HCH transport system substrate-binding protein n=1 Tax=Gordonia humi TaxID=686429 RepID=A0A840F2J3_9ACTN|nr:MCE family protein [Gordonia humi]MBB4134530.1 phospholipid/cholesterol/gamma-HCH transport system substrate-binding protein [Gordonia humi]